MGFSFFGEDGIRLVVEEEVGLPAGVTEAKGKLKAVLWRPVKGSNTSFYTFNRLCFYATHEGDKRVLC